MAEWYVKQLSKLTKVSVRTLHHYDQIGLLKPSIRLENGYRLYSETDLLKLQLIIALKFFGFTLSQIQRLLKNEAAILTHFQAQSRFLKEKAERLSEASKALERLVAETDLNKSIPWETVLELIEVYTMTQQLEKTWAGKVLSPDELKEYATFEQGLKTRFTLTEKSAFEQNWANLVNKIKNNLDKDPMSDFGTSIGKECMELINGLYGKKHAGLRRAIWEKGYKTGQMDAEQALPPEVVAWLDQAKSTYYKKRIYGVLAQIKGDSEDQVSKEWEDLLEDMYGYDQAPKDALHKAALDDASVSQVAKSWIQKTYNV